MERPQRSKRTRDANLEEVKHLMNLSFYTKCTQVNLEKNIINGLLKEWPFWFNELEWYGSPLQGTYWN